MVAIAIPVFVYLFHTPLLEATTYSLLVVTFGAAISLLLYIRNKVTVPFKKLISFVLPTVTAVILTRTCDLPLLPTSFNIFDVTIPQEIYLMTAFSLLGVVAGYGMLKPLVHKHSHHKPYMLSLAGAGVGILTGIFGTGGGFLIVPTLRRYGHMETNKAVVASLTVVTLNSAIGFTTSFVKTPPHNMTLLALFIAFVIIGIVAGSSSKLSLPSRVKEKVLGYLIITVSVISGVLVFI